MKQNRALILLPLMITSIIGVFRVSRADDSTAITPKSTLRLFDGTSLDGWYTYVNRQRGDDPSEVFRVVDGCICISGESPGYLGSNDTYRDYTLRLEFRWGTAHFRGDKAKDSGLFLHSTGPDGNSYDAEGAFRAGIECQIMQGAVGDLMLIRGSDQMGRDLPLTLTTPIAGRDPEGWPFYHPNGKAYTLTKWGRINWQEKSRQWHDRLNMTGPAEVEKPAGQWNQLECRCEGGRVTIRLNGAKVNEAVDVWPTSGNILLQSEGSEIFFRRIVVRPLNP